MGGIFSLLAIESIYHGRVNQVNHDAFQGHLAVFVRDTLFTLPAHAWNWNKQLKLIELNISEEEKREQK